MRWQNKAGSRYIGQTGGNGGGGMGSVHAHILYAHSRAALDTIVNFKKDGAEIGNSMRPYVADFRSLIRR
jgi:hypothetical protein